MLTTNTAPTISNRVAVSQIESMPSADEIADRVLAIRSQWDLRERIERRRVAEKRFAHLVDALTGTAHAA